jgi:hypothetical protein
LLLALFVVLVVVVILQPVFLPSGPSFRTQSKFIHVLFFFDSTASYF